MTQTLVKTSTPIIGLFIDGISTQEQSGLVCGITDTLTRQGASLITIPGHTNFRSLKKYSFLDNPLLEHLAVSDIDGLIIAATQGRAYSSNSFRRMREHFSGVPMVSIFHAHAEIPCVTIDNEQGFLSLVKHLVKDHGFHKISFVNGPFHTKDADLKLKILCNILKEWSIPLDLNAIVNGDYSRLSGDNATTTLLDIRGIMPQAIIAANDEMAFGIIDALTRKGIRAPLDIAVTGFNDSDGAAYITPSLTTVRQPLVRAGAKAASMMLQTLHGTPSSLRETLTGELIIRQSCGCPAGANAKNVFVTHQQKQHYQPNISIHFQQETVIDEMVEAMMLSPMPGTVSTHYLEWAKKLYKAFFVEVTQKLVDVFLPVLNDIVHATTEHGGNILAWQESLWILRHHSAKFFTSSEHAAADILLQQGHIAIAESGIRFAGLARQSELHYLSTFHSFIQSLATTFDLQHLLNIISEGLHSLGLFRSFLVLCGETTTSLLKSILVYTPYSQGVSTLVLAIDNKKHLRFESHKNVFFYKQLLPPGMLRNEDRFSFIAMPLLSMSSSELLGFLLVETQSSRYALAELLAEQISSALNATVLVKTVQDKTNDISLANRSLELEIIQRTKAQEELFAAKILAENANRSKSFFLASMSHELRTPLNAIVGYSEMLAEDAEENENVQLAADLNKIKKAGTHLRAIVNDILDLSKIEAGKMSLYLETFQVCLILQEVTETIGPQCTHGPTFKTPCTTDVGSMHADLTKVRQIIINILSNAVKFTKQGVVQLSAKRINKSNTTWIYFTVSDTGIGMTAQQVALIFDAFSQADSKTSSIFGGTGLGLAISRGLCKLMGGDISVTSELGVGSEFTIMLPAYVEQPADKKH